MPTAFTPSVERTPIGLFNDDDYATQRAFYRMRPDLASTPLRVLPARARQLGLGGLYIKDETARFGLSAFKATGALFAVAVLMDRGEIKPGDTLACASEGNHGRAVARAARDADCGCLVYMADSVAPSRVQAIESEGAQVMLVPGTYDDAVRMLARDAKAHGWRVISDTSIDDDHDVPRLIMLGYTRLLDEAEASWGTPPDLIFVPGGVGGLIAAVASWSHWRFGSKRPRIVAVEPLKAACLQASARQGQPVAVEGPFDTVMGGLRCGEVSRGAFPAVLSMVSSYIAIEDEWSFRAMRHLARPLGDDPRIEAGPSGAAALGGLLAILSHGSLADLAARLGLRRAARVMAIATEGVTEPDLFAQVVGPTGEAQDSTGGGWA